MVVWGIITSIFWALVISSVLWTLCAFAGRLVNANYQTPVVMHLFYFLIAIPTAILLFVFLTSGRVNRMVDKVDANVDFSEYLILKKYADTNQILKNGSLSSTEIVKGIKAKVKSTRRKALIAVILLQAIPFGVTFYRASKYRSPAQISQMYGSSGDYL